MKRWFLFTLILIVTLSLAACAGSAPTGEQAAGGEGEMTFVDTPRNETLILDNLDGSLERPDFFNIYAPGVSAGRGFHELCTDHLWDIDTTTGEQFGSLAADLPTPLNDDFTSWEIKLREGIYWDDDVEFTAEDVAFTFQMWFDNEDLAIHGWAVDYIDSWEVVARNRNFTS